MMMIGSSSSSSSDEKMTEELAALDGAGRRRGPVRAVAEAVTVRGGGVSHLLLACLLACLAVLSPSSRRFVFEAAPDGSDGDVGRLVERGLGELRGEELPPTPLAVEQALKGRRALKKKKKMMMTMKKAGYDARTYHDGKKRRRRRKKTKVGNAARTFDGWKKTMKKVGEEPPAGPQGLRGDFASLVPAADKVPQSHAKVKKKVMMMMMMKKKKKKGGEEEEEEVQPAGPQDGLRVDVANMATSGQVLPSDTVLTYPAPTASLPLLAPITAYNWRGADLFPADKFERPIYKNLHRDDMEFWNYLVDELLLSRVPVVLLHGRGCSSPTDNNDFSGPGNMCPRYLKYFVDAVRLAGAENAIKVGMFDTNDGAKKALAGIPPDGQLDLSNETNWKYFWDYNIKIVFDILPKEWWFLLDGKPVIATWNLRDRNFKHQQGNASRLITWLKAQFKFRYNVEPTFILQDNWFHEDSTLNDEHAMGQHCWFTPVSNVKESVSSVCPFNDQFWSVAAPGFRDPNTVAGCGEECREVTRRNGKTLVHALNLAVEKDATMVMLEGWTNMVESGGFYRSDHWAYPTKYINIVRKFSDPEPETLRFQAEGADAFFDTSQENEGNQYADRTLDVGKLKDGSGWYVGFTAENEWLEYQSVKLGCGQYRFTARVATRNDDKKMHLEVGSKTLPTLNVPDTGSIESYQLVHLGQLDLLGGSYNIRLVFESTGGLNVDWFFVKRSNPPTSAPITFQIVFQYDKFPGQTSWSVQDITAGRRVAGVPSKKSRRFPRFKKFVKEPANFVSGHQYLVKLKDRKGNGFKAGRKGYIRIKAIHKGSVIWSKTYRGGSVRFRKAYKFLMPTFRFVGDQLCKL